MEWMAIADECWRYRPWVTWGAMLVYAVPLLRIIGYPFESGGLWCMGINRWFGYWEYIISWLRDSLGSLYLLGAIGWYLFLSVRGRELAPFLVASGALGLLGAAVLNRVWKRRAKRLLLDFIRKHPTIHPQEFFDHFFCSQGALRHNVDRAPYRLIDPTSVDFRVDDKHEPLRFARLRGVWCTICLSRLSMHAYRWQGIEFLRAVLGSLAVIWGTRLAQLARIAVIIEGAEKLRGLSPYSIYLFNHASFFDFAVAPLLMPARGDGSEKGFTDLPRFLIAKDHFIDNPILNHLLGIGRVIQAMGMVVVDRKNSRLAGARLVVAEAVKKLIDDQIPLAIFPQGTRARAYISADGERMGSAYYTAGSFFRIKRDGGHLKKGAAYMAIDAAKLLVERDPKAFVNLVPVGLLGTALVCPRGTLRLQAGAVIRLKVGEPMTILPSDVRHLDPFEGKEPQGERQCAYAAYVDRLHSSIDESLRTVLGVHAELDRRFFEDMRDMLTPHQFEEMSVAMKAWRGNDSLVYSILDGIYACHPDRWRMLQGELVHLLLSDASREKLLDLKARVAEALSK